MSGAMFDSLSDHHLVPFKAMGGHQCFKCFPPQAYSTLWGLVPILLSIYMLPLGHHTTDDTQVFLSCDPSNVTEIFLLLNRSRTFING